MQINDKWRFAKLPDIDSIENVNRIETIRHVNTCEVNLPHTWYKDGDAYQGCVCYQKKMMLSYQENHRIFLNFEGADRWCRIFINQNYIGDHKGGYSAFTYDITAYVIPGSENVITVLLDNRSYHFISPLIGDFTVFGGLYRGINLIETGDLCFDRSYYGTQGVLINPDFDGDQGVLAVEPHVVGSSDHTVEYQYEILDAEKHMVYRKTMDYANPFEIRINRPRLWNGKEDPYLYELKSTVIKDQKIIDQVEIPFGFRSVAIDAERGFLLNGKRMKINGVSKHQDFAGVFHATTIDHQKQDLNDILEIGANSVRLSHYQHPQQMYDLSDQSGLIVWTEIPMLRLTEEKAVFENALSQMKELILQNMHHPSIAFWGIQNEIAMYEETEYTYQKMQELNAYVKELDHTRISSCANLYCVKNDSKLNRITDAAGYNIYFGWYYGEMNDSGRFADEFHKACPDIPLGITEYGVDCNLAYHSSKPKVKDYSEEFQALYHETVYGDFQKRKYLWGTYVWNLYDFGSSARDEGGVKYRNCKGLISYDRKIKKDAFYYYKAQWSKDAFVRIAQRRFVNRVEDKVQIKVYSNLPEVTLIANGHSFMKQSSTGVFRFDDIALVKGRNCIKALAGDFTDTIFLNRVEEPDQSYVYTDKNPGVNVKNWFADALEEEKLFPPKKYSIRDTSRDLMQSDSAMTVIEAFNPELAKSMRENVAQIPLERILNHMKKDFSDEQCRELNRRLTLIDK